MAEMARRRRASARTLAVRITRLRSMGSPDELIGRARCGMRPRPAPARRRPAGCRAG
jgi:hypothetical protein